MQNSYQNMFTLFKVKGLEDIIKEENIARDRKSQRQDPGGITVIRGLVEGRSTKEIGD